jgi:ferric-dicitrate binding protein FerR (iron transport regulator)
MTPERLEELMVRAVDGLATPAEREELMAYVTAHPEHGTELDAHRAIKAVTDGWVARLDVDLAVDANRTSTVSRIEGGLGMGLLLAGLAIFGGFGLTALVLDPEVPAWVKLGTALCCSGGLVLLLAAVRRRLTTMPSDRYNEVIR